MPNHFNVSDAQDNRTRILHSAERNISGYAANNATRVTLCSYIRIPLVRDHISPLGKRFYGENEVMTVLPSIDGCTDAYGMDVFFII